MATGAAATMLRCIFDGCLSVQDMEIERRPYHRNCRCALHSLKGVSSDACSHRGNISFPKKQPWTNCCLHNEAFRSSFQCSSLGDFSKRNREDANTALSHAKFSRRFDKAWGEEN